VRLSPKLKIASLLIIRCAGIGTSFIREARNDEMEPSRNASPSWVALTKDRRRVRRVAVVTEACRCWVGRVEGRSVGAGPA